MILPSRAESFPYVLLEGAANGLALLSTRVGSVEEILKNERNGFFIDPDNIDQISAMIKRFADDRDLVNAMGAYSKELCKTKFPLSRLEDIYKKLLTE